jgi:hypothetical protein
MRTMYFAEDGKQFEDKKACIAYEEQKAAAEAEKMKKEQEREARQKEVEDAFKNYKDLLNKYLEDYETYTHKSTDLTDYPFMDYLFRAFNL